MNGNGDDMEPTTAADTMFSLTADTLAPGKRAVFSLLATPLEHLLGLRRCREIYRCVGHLEDPECFMRQTLEELKIEAACGPGDAGKIPSKGGCVVVSNHPFGGIEGVILAQFLLSVRKDVKILANALLDRMPQLRKLTLAVDPFGGDDAPRANLASLRQAMRWVKNGGLLLVFPAGEVAHLNLRRREICDPPWHPSVARIVHHAQATVVPVFFEGRNSLLFQAAGLLHPRLRTALLARELIGKNGTSIHFKIGNAISYRWLRQYKADDRLLEYLRWRTHIMGHPRRRPLKMPLTAIPGGAHRLQPPAEAQSAEMCRRELARLPISQRLVQSGTFGVWYARAEQIPQLLQEIGRLREISFRQAGEGTGKPLDLDRFDQHYLHLFIWNDETSEIVGAYRLGQTDHILSAMGRKGLYTSTLFHSRMDFFHQLGPALEMGRSFVRPEYQKSYSPLLLLWKGIGAYVARNPRYRMLFGPVSISRDYSDLSRRLMATTLMRHNQAKELALMVKPRKPARLNPIRIRGCRETTHDVEFQDFKEVCSVVADIEFEQKEVPVLLRQYLNLGGQILSFNIDKLFSDVMDGLIVVDLLQTERKTLERYMSAEGLFTFLAHHYAASFSGHDETMGRSA
jgi:putative hemolysin